MAVQPGGSRMRRATATACMQSGDSVVFSVRPSPPAADNGAGPRHFQVSYEAFVHDVRVGDYLMVDGGMVIVRVRAIEGPDVTGEVMEPGRVMSRATITLRRGKELVRGHSTMLPVVTAKDWQDIDFAVEQKVRGPAQRALPPPTLTMRVSAGCGLGRCRRTCCCTTEACGRVHILFGWCCPDPAILVCMRTD